MQRIALPGTDLALEMVYVPGGRIAPGSGAPLLPFWISKREVTWAEFDEFYEKPGEEKVDGVTRPSAGKSYLGLSGLPSDFLDRRRPATGLRFHSAVVYCEWLSRRTGRTFRLPTESEWEFACRAGSPPGAPELLGEHAWFEANSDERTHEAGGRKPNAWGIHDMLGNAWEYCLEPHEPPGFGPVLRGGAWNSLAADVRATLRKSVPPAWSESDPSRPLSSWWFRTDFTQGFRVVLVPETAGARAQEAYARKIEIKVLKSEERVARIGPFTTLFHRVTGEVRNGGDRSLDELAIKVHFLRPDGKPHLADAGATTTRHATFNVCFPALVNSAHPGPHARPLKPAESRGFLVDVPTTFDPADQVQPNKLGASVTSLRFSSE